MKAGSRHGAQRPGAPTDALLRNGLRAESRLAAPQAARVIRDGYRDRVQLVAGPVPAGGVGVPELAQLDQASLVSRSPLLLAEGAPVYGHHPGRMPEPLLQARFRQKTIMLRGISVVTEHLAA